MKAEELVVTLADTLDEAETEALGDKSRNVEADTLLVRKAKTVLETLRGVEAIKLLYILADTVGKTEAGKLRQTPADTLAEAMMSTLGDV